jgi:hypothetical protein
LRPDEHFPGFWIVPWLPFQPGALFWTAVKHYSTLYTPMITYGLSLGIVWGIVKVPKKIA